MHNPMQSQRISASDCQQIKQHRDMPNPPAQNTAHEPSWHNPTLTHAGIPPSLQQLVLRTIEELQLRGLQRPINCKQPKNGSGSVNTAPCQNIHQRAPICSPHTVKCKSYPSPWRRAYIILSALPHETSAMRFYSCAMQSIRFQNSRHIRLRTILLATCHIQKQ